MILHQQDIEGDTTFNFQNLDSGRLFGKKTLLDSRLQTSFNLTLLAVKKLCFLGLFIILSFQFCCTAMEN